MSPRFYSSLYGTDAATSADPTESVFSYHNAVTPSIRLSPSFHTYMPSLAEFWSRCWRRYVPLCPDALTIHRLLLQTRGETRLVNDHVALRTFNLPGIDRRALGRRFEPYGYVRADTVLAFPEKNLLADYYLHPNDPTQPKVFISEFLVERAEPSLRTWIESVVSSATPAARNPHSLQGFLEPSWQPVAHADYRRFYAQSEYAAWTAAFGLQVNHFTVHVNHLLTLASLRALNEHLKTLGIALNSSGGEIKGSRAECLEQSSTIARPIPWTFSDGVYPIAGCYYEFAQRHPDPATGQMYEGFVPANANHIFESTHESSAPS